MSDDKIYKELNNIQVDIDEIEVDEVTKKRIKKKVQSRINKKGNNKLKYLAAVAVMVVSLPVSYEVISEVKKHFFYENGVGIMESKNLEINNLIEPIAFGENDKYVLKNVIEKAGGIEIGLWVDYSENVKTDDVYIKLENGEKIKSSSLGIGCGGEQTYFDLFFPTNSTVKTFELFVGDESTKVDLVGVEKTDDYKELGSYDEKKNLILGGNKYDIKDKTYISFWNNLSLEHSNILVNDINKDDIIVKDEEENSISVKDSAYNGMQTEFVLDKKYDGKLDVLIKKIQLGYSFNEASKSNKVKLELPKKNTKEFLNQSLELEHFGTVDIVSIESVEENITVELDVSKLNKEGIEVSMLGMKRNGVGGIGSDGKSNCFISIDRSDLSLGEKLSNKLELEINNIDFYIKDEWKFMIE